VYVCGDVGHVRGDVGGLTFGEVELQRSFANSAVSSAGFIQQEGAQDFSIEILHQVIGSNDIRAAFLAAARILAMTIPAIGFISLLAARDRGLVAGRARRKGVGVITDSAARSLTRLRRVVRDRTLGEQRSAEKEWENRDPRHPARK